MWHHQCPHRWRLRRWQWRRGTGTSTRSAAPRLVSAVTQGQRRLEAISSQVRPAVLPIRWWLPADQSNRSAAVVVEEPVRVAGFLAAGCVQGSHPFVGQGQLGSLQVGLQLTDCSHTDDGAGNGWLGHHPGRCHPGRCATHFSGNGANGCGYIPTPVVLTFDPRFVVSVRRGRRLRYGTAPPWPVRPGPGARPMISSEFPPV